MRSERYGGGDRVVVDAWVDRVLVAAVGGIGALTSATVLVAGSLAPDRDVRTGLWVLGFSGLTATTVLLLRTVAQGLHRQSVQGDAFADGPRATAPYRRGYRSCSASSATVNASTQPAIDVLQARDRARARSDRGPCRARACSVACLLAVAQEHEVERQPLQQPEPVGPQVGEAPDQRDRSSSPRGPRRAPCRRRRTRCQWLRSSDRVNCFPSLPMTRPRAVEHLVAPAELEDGLRLDHEQVRARRPA